MRKVVTLSLHQHYFPTIPAEFDPLHQRLHGASPAGISDGVYRSPPMENPSIDDGGKEK
jgi:hypothetical protein